MTAALAARTVTISRLRRKLGDPLIITTTTPGAGYRIASRTAQDRPSAI
jgi:DNA-binding response OmpR family regulator